MTPGNDQDGKRSSVTKHQFPYSSAGGTARSQQARSEGSGPFCENQPCSQDGARFCDAIDPKSFEPKPPSSDHHLGIRVPKCLEKGEPDESLVDLVLSKWQRAVSAGVLLYSRLRLSKQISSTSDIGQLLPLSSEDPSTPSSLYSRGGEFKVSFNVQDRKLALDLPKVSPGMSTQEAISPAVVKPGQNVETPAQLGRFDAAMSSSQPPMFLKDQQPPSSGCSNRRKSLGYGASMLAFFMMLLIVALIMKFCIIPSLVQSHLNKSFLQVNRLALSFNPSTVALHIETTIYTQGRVSATAKPFLAKMYHLPNPLERHNFTKLTRHLQAETGNPANLSELEAASPPSSGSETCSKLAQTNLSQGVHSNASLKEIERSFQTIVETQIDAEEVIHFEHHHYSPLGRFIVPETRIKGRASRTDYNTVLHIDDMELFQNMLEEIVVRGQAVNLLHSIVSLKTLGMTFENLHMTKVIALSGMKLSLDDREKAYLHGTRANQQFAPQLLEEKLLEKEQNIELIKIVLGDSPAEPNFVSIDLTINFNLPEGSSEAGSLTPTIDSIGILTMQQYFASVPIFTMESNHPLSINPGPNYVDLHGMIPTLDDAPEAYRDAMESLMAKLISGHTVFFESRGVASSLPILDRAIKSTHFLFPLRYSEDRRLLRSIDFVDMTFAPSADSEDQFLLHGLLHLSLMNIFMKGNIIISDITFHGVVDFFSTEEERYERLGEIIGSLQGRGIASTSNATENDLAETSSIVQSIPQTLLMNFQASIFFQPNDDSNALDQPLESEHNVSRFDVLVKHVIKEETLRLRLLDLHLDITIEDFPLGKAVPLKGLHIPEQIVPIRGFNNFGDLKLLGFHVVPKTEDTPEGPKTTLHISIETWFPYVPFTIDLGRLTMEVLYEDSLVTHIQSEQNVLLRPEGARIGWHGILKSMNKASLHLMRALMINRSPPITVRVIESDADNLPLYIRNSVIGTELELKLSKIEMG